MNQTNDTPSAINMVDRHKQAFEEEAREILVELESTLLELNENHGDGELIGTAFRALHTIKGSGAMFGFDRLAAFTHNLENAFEQIRTGQLGVTSEIIDLSLSALDQIKLMLDEANPGVEENARSTEILERLHALTGLPNAGCVSGSQPPATISPDFEKQTRDWRIRFIPGPDLIRNGSDPRLLLRDLRQLGSLHAQADMAAVPSISELDPDRCYISWEMILTTSATIEEIRDVFIFVEDCCELIIEQVPDQAERSLNSVPRVQEERRSLAVRRRDDRESSIRVPSDKLDQLVNLVGELVTVQARMNEIAANSDNPEVIAVSEEIDRLTSSLRENSMSIRMLPIRATFERFRRLVHDLAKDLRKTVELTIEGADTELDKTVIDQLNDPLMHLIRNSMDHGIESSEARVASGKPPVATIHLSARHSGANVLIRITDDGGGIDSDAVRQRAIARGMISADTQLTEAEVFALILEPGFSTALQVTDVSGRGVGMDVVRQRVEALRGRIDISSKPGEGTIVTLCLPLTMAIIDGLLVRVGDTYFVLPLANTLECIELTRQDIEKANGRHLVNVRGEIIPYISLREQFDIQTERPEREQIMVADTEHGRYGFVVDQVIGDHQTVIKSLGRFYRNVKIISGATILGNGNVALILDPDRVIQDALREEALRTQETHRSSVGTTDSKSIKDICTKDLLPLGRQQLSNESN